MSHDWLIEQFKGLDAVKPGEYELASGEDAEYYVDVKLAYSHPLVRKYVNEALAELIPKDVTLVATDDGAMASALASGVADEFKIPFAVVREKRKTRGTKKRVEGSIPENPVFAVVNDVWTRGTTSKPVRTALEEREGVFTGYYMVVCRADPAPEDVDYLLHINDLLEE